MPFIAGVIIGTTFGMCFDTLMVQSTDPMHYATTFAIVFPIACIVSAFTYWQMNR